jgi:hypothetical protein
MTSTMGESLRTSNRIATLEDTVSALRGDLIDTQGKLSALERRFEDFTLGRFSPPEPDLSAIPGTNVSVRVFDDPPNQAFKK